MAKSASNCIPNILNYYEKKRGIFSEAFNVFFFYMLRRENFKMLNECVSVVFPFSGSELVEVICFAYRVLIYRNDQPCFITIIFSQFIFVET